jgi:UDP-N-acetylmuramyl pentapeptide phosphotransferase/UDP-N-acetylglucosamine-1-phosphate transferase
VVEFVVNLYVFPFLAEVALVPIIALFVGMQVVAAYDDSVQTARKPIGFVLAAMSLFLLIHAAVEAIRDPGGLFTRENLESVLIAPGLTFAFLPFLAAWAWISRRELNNARKQILAGYDFPG